MPCKCQGCGCEYKVDLLLPDSLWFMINRGKILLCGGCIIKNIEKLGRHGALEVRYFNLESINHEW